MAKGTSHCHLHAGKSITMNTVHVRQWNKIKLDNMRWFSYRRSLSPPCGHAMVSSVAACCVRPSYGAGPTMHCQWGWLSSFFFFCSWWPWPLTLTFELGRDFCTVYLTAKFHHLTFNRSEVIVRTNKHTDKQTDKQTPLKTSTALRYATPVGNNCIIGRQNDRKYQISSSTYKI